jgi:asparagine synthase (glutamine-hydrolysing)
MCGIFALLNNSSQVLTNTFLKEQFEKGRKRGPEYSVLKNVMIKADFGFHRLAINGLDDISNQPIVYDDIVLICNGEIYNYKELYKDMNIDEPITNSDCEVILHLYKRFGIEQTLQLLDGVFSFVLIDYRISNSSSKMYVARDPYGVRPLYMLKQQGSTKYSNNSNDLFENPHNHTVNAFVIDDKTFAFASELKVLYEIKEKLNDFVHEKRRTKRHMPFYKISQFTPGTYSEFELKFIVNSQWTLQKNHVSYHSLGFQSNILDGHPLLENLYKNIQYYLKSAVEKRCSTTQRPIACLLSGGLDSSLIAALVNEYHKKNNLPRLETYSIGLSGSEDLKYARIVADYLGTKHSEIIVSEQDFLDAIPEVIYDIESYDTTSVRASIGNWLLGKYISQNSEAKVIFNGDGSDELCGGYLYMNYAPTHIDFDKECRRLLKDIHAFDVLRSDKCISSHGLEPRTPFLDRTWTQFYMSIPSSLRFHKLTGSMEKSLLRNAFSIAEYRNMNGNALLPEEVLMRRKEAFSDGVSKTSRSLYEIIQEYTDQMEGCPYTNPVQYNKQFPELENHLLPTTSEQYYYRNLFESHYSGMGKIVPYFWMPKFVNALDASARTLDIYKE